MQQMIPNFYTCRHYAQQNGTYSIGVVQSRDDCWVLTGTSNACKSDRAGLTTSGVATHMYQGCPLALARHCVTCKGPQIASSV